MPAPQSILSLFQANRESVGSIAIPMMLSPSIKNGATIWSLHASHKKR
jgi:hypothetical protein